MRILVTGGAGFIGSHYVRTLLTGGYPGYADASLDDSLLRSMGYAPRIPFPEGLEATVEWYAANRSWWEPLPRPVPPERAS
jgi:nucleoside-diphosphate-sugar epimerase